MSIRALAFFVTILTSATVPAAQVGANLENFFNEMGAQANVTSGGSFQGQTRNLMTGGSLYMRVPQQSYNLASIQAPALKAGCGGIDLFAGSFSYINKEQFVAMMRNIGNNAVGYAFNLAIDAIDPMIGNVLKDMRKTLENVNNMNINSCETGQALVNGIVGKTNLSAQQGCQNFSALLNITDDRLDAWGNCSDPVKRSQVQTAIRGNAEAKDAAPLTLVSGNLMARVLEKSFPWMSNTEKALLVSMTGTFLVDASGEKPRFTIVAPSLTDERDIVAGVQGSNDANLVNLSLLSDCVDPDQTTCAPPQAVSIPSIRALVLKKFETFNDEIETGVTSWGAGKKQEMVDFVNISSVPVLRVLMTDFGSNTKLGDAYLDLIAAQYAIHFLQQSVSQAAAAVGNYPSLDEQEAKAVTSFRDRLVGLREVLNRNETSTHTRAAAIAQLQLQIEQQNRQIRQAAPKLSMRPNDAAHPLAVSRN
jgi:conjugative transfer pilus assembly protein TraH